MRIIGLVQLCMSIMLAGCGSRTTLPDQLRPPSEEMPDFAVIAHRGASGYLPEHTLEAAAMAHSMGADYIEQDVVLTGDDVLIVLHDLYLDAVTNVARQVELTMFAELFPVIGQKDHQGVAPKFGLVEMAP